MNKKLLLSSVLCTVVMVGCSKTSPLLEKNKDYIGEWKNETSSLKIEKNGDAKFVRHVKAEDKTASSEIKTSSLSDIKAPITQFDGQHLTIGQGNLSQDFQITKAPYKQDGKWKVILNGEVYTKD